MPLQSLSSSTPSPFFDAAILEQQWKELDGMLSVNKIGAYDLAGKNVGVICYHGDTARVATSVLRSKGITASSIKGGFQALSKQLPSLQRTNRVSFQQWLETSDASDSDLEGDLSSPKLGPRHEVLVNAP